MKGKGGDNTFEDFPRHLGALVEKALPKINVLPLVYPKFETRGDLHDTVARFKDWYAYFRMRIEVQNLIDYFPGSRIKS